MRKILSIALCFMFLASPVLAGKIVSYNPSHLRQGKQVEIKKTLTLPIVRTITSWRFNGLCIEYYEVKIKSTYKEVYEDGNLVSRGFEDEELISETILDTDCLF